MNRARPSRWALSFLAVAVAALVLMPSAATADDNPRIERIEILVLRMPDKEQVGVLRPGDVLELQVGQTVRLRLSAIPSRLRPRYPSTRFELESGHRAVTVGRTNDEVGSITLSGARADSREAVVTYQITDPIDVSKDLRNGRVRVRVVEAESSPEVGYPSGPGGFRGLTLYADSNFRGRSQAFGPAQVADLGGSGIGNDSASSLRVTPGCRANLYADDNFRGAMTVVDGDLSDLGRSPVGNDRVSSLTVECGGSGGGSHPGQGRGVTLYSDANFRGDSQTFSADTADLNGTRIRPNRASSARVDPGCRAVLYEDAGFHGAAVLLDRDIADFGHSPGFRNDSVSSLTVECHR